MKHRLTALALWLVCGPARAAGPLVGLEFEAEKNNDNGITNHAVEMVAGWEFPEKSFINRVELLIQRNQDARADADGLRAKENKLFVRIRHDGRLTDALDYYILVGIGRSFNNEGSFNYAYAEPGIEYKLRQNLAWTMAIREINSIDSASGRHITQLRTGPGVVYGKGNELQFLYVKANGDANLSAWVLEYIHKF